MNRKKNVKNLLEKLKTHIFALDYMVNCTYVQRTLQYSGGYNKYMYAREEKKAKMGSADLLRTCETPDTGPVRDTGRSPSRWATPTHTRRDTSPYSGS